MAVLFLFPAFLQVVVAARTEVPGYIGENVTLHSGANPSWNLTKIDWSVYSNSTWIATYSNGETNTERWFLYKDRLTLNTTSGDLTIHNLKPSDAMEYIVDLINTDRQHAGHKIKLEMKKRLQEPNIENIFNDTTESGCFVALNCTSPDDGVKFNWTTNSPETMATWMNEKTGYSPIYAYLKKHDNAEFTCTSYKGMENRMNVFTPLCEGPQHLKKECKRCQNCFFHGFLGSILTAVVIVVLYVCRGYLKTAWQCLKEKPLSSSY
ncbi:uncharacterized protein si:cabz01074946.1 isoform X2 [Cololabis saira]|uniref:uncharacterized protein si:cabz01074946.1 isoform X2 n=1 Tax=Cololabis saira TaxID=129043 RepID=UPI002AD3729D|nr:uncharacterized protein si:cabz01074946.1 isoform X2 [Cololabis saira]